MLKAAAQRCRRDISVEPSHPYMESPSGAAYSEHGSPLFSVDLIRKTGSILSIATFQVSKRAGLSPHMLLTLFAVSECGQPLFREYGDAHGSLPLTGLPSRNGSQTGLPGKLFSLLQFCYFCKNSTLPCLYKAFLAVGTPVFDLKIVPTVGRRFSPIRALMIP